MPKEFAPFSIGGWAVKNTLALSAAAIALLFTSMSAAAYAQGPSDSLTVGPFGFADLGEVPGEAARPLPLADVQTTLTSLPSPATETIFLTDPGTTDISDIVSATLHTSALAMGILLDVTLTSGDESSLGSLSPGVTSLDETGAAQDLTSTFNGLFDLSTSLPTITVTSDLDAVPEPSTWAMMVVGFCLLGLAGMQKTREAIGT
jgi:hypothetical protein